LTLWHLEAGERHTVPVKRLILEAEAMPVLRIAAFWELSDNTCYTDFAFAVVF
jgi:hypothetical protein